LKHRSYITDTFVSTVIMAYVLSSFVNTCEKKSSSSSLREEGGRVNVNPILNRAEREDKRSKI